MNKTLKLGEYSIAALGRGAHLCHIGPSVCGGAWPFRDTGHCDIHVKTISIFKLSSDTNLKHYTHIKKKKKNSQLQRTLHRFHRNSSSLNILTVKNTFVIYSDTLAAETETLTLLVETLALFTDTVSFNTNSLSFHNHTQF